MEKLPSILLVDDDATTNFLNEKLLRSLGVTDRVLMAEGGAEALALLERTAAADQPALILLDVVMPGINGIEFLEAYHRLPAARHRAPVVVMLATTMSANDLTRLDELSIAGLVSKPLTKEKIDYLLQLHFRRQLPAA